MTKKEELFVHSVMEKEHVISMTRFVQNQNCYGCGGNGWYEVGSFKITDEANDEIARSCPGLYQFIKDKKK